jgi:hypothetical protein
MGQPEITNEALGEPLSTENKVLTTGASITQVHTVFPTSSCQIHTQRS